MRDLIRFNSFIRKESSCWLWIGGRSSGGYGNFYVNGKTVTASRYALSLVRKPTKDKTNALHTCDVRACVNPSHLYWGTLSDNSRDAVERGRIQRGEMAFFNRHPEKRLYWEKNGRNIISQSMAIHIKMAIDAGEKRSDLAKKYGVSVVTISRAFYRVKGIYGYGPKPART